MKIQWGKTLLSTVLAVGVAMSAQAGNMVVTGHDTDDHRADQWFDWAMTYLMTGNGTGYDTSSVETSGLNIAYLSDTGRTVSSTYFGGYNSSVTRVNLSSATWTDVFNPGAYDVIVVGTGRDFVSATGSATMNTQAAAFETYFNAGGNLLVNSEQGLGSSFYDFLPAFGATNNAGLPGCSSGVPCMGTATGGAAIGMNDTLVAEASITHTRFLNVDSAFTTVEQYQNNGGAGSGDAITIAFSGTIQCDPTDPAASCFIPPVTGVPEASSIALMGLGLFGLGFTRRKNKSA